MPKKRNIRVVHRKLGREGAHGLAHTDERIIEIEERISGKDYLETIIHEILHVQNPKFAEIRIQGNAKEIADILWKHHFRWVDL